MAATPPGPTNLAEARRARARRGGRPGPGPGPDDLPASLDEALGRVSARLAPSAHALPVAVPPPEPAPAPALRAWLPRVALLGLAVVGSWGVVLGTGAAVWALVG